MKRSAAWLLSWFGMLLVAGTAATAADTEPLEDYWQYAIVSVLRFVSDNSDPAVTSTDARVARLEASRARAEETIVYLIEVAPTSEEMRDHFRLLPPLQESLAAMTSIVDAYRAKDQAALAAADRWLTSAVVDLKAAVGEIK